VNPSAVFVQFPHPGTEHNPGKLKRQPWNRGEHRRKFLLSDGRYVAADRSLCEAPLVFWGEWEAPSYIKKEWSREGSLPQFLHLPVWERPADSQTRQNTDPWVFGSSFLYSNCKQQNRSSSWLRQLPPASVILFGSTPGGNFVIDTVFVVASSCPFAPAEEPPECDDAFVTCTIEALRTDEEAARKRFTLHRGATYEAPINGTYSFVPCRVEHTEEARFQRPSISLPACYVNTKSRQARKGATRRPLAEVHDLWENVREQVLAAGCLLGVHFSTPRFDHSRAKAP
jgi:hypothetical protein